MLNDCRSGIPSLKVNDLIKRKLFASANNLIHDSLARKEEKKRTHHSSEMQRKIRKRLYKRISQLQHYRG